MKIAYIGTRGIPPNYGGSEMYVEQMALYLSRRGDEVWVYGSALTDDPVQRERAKGYPKNIHRLEVPTLRTKHADNFFRSLLATLHVCFQRDIELVEFTNLGSAVFSFLPRFFGKKVVGSIRALDSRRAKWGPLARTYLRLCERLIYLLPHVTTTNSLEIVAYYREHYQVDVRYTPNGAVFPNNSISPDEIQRWGLNGKDYLLFVGRLVPEKQCHILLRAFQEMEWPNMKLVIAGGDSFAPDYVQQLRGMSSDRVLFTGHVSGAILEDLFENAYAFVLPSAVEGMSNALLSAMAHKRPVVVSDIPENLAVVNGAYLDSEMPESLALVFRLGDWSDLADKLAVLRDNPDDASHRGIALHAHVRKNFSWDSSAERTRSIYSEIVK